jgi:hypothetical protein
MGVDPAQVPRIRTEGIPLGGECVHPTAESNEAVPIVFSAELVVEADLRRVARQDESAGGSQRGKDAQAV